MPRVDKSDIGYTLDITAMYQPNLHRVTDMMDNYTEKRGNIVTVYGRAKEIIISKEQADTVFGFYAPGEGWHRWETFRGVPLIVK